MILMKKQINHMSKIIQKNGEGLLFYLLFCFVMFCMCFFLGFVVAVVVVAVCFVSVVVLFF